MANKATTVDQQIELLKSRGMIILPEDHEKAKEYLLDIGYYRLGFYWYYFELDKQHNFIKGTRLNDALDLYYFDVDLRNLLSKYLYRIEVHFRTQVVYLISNHYRESPTWFIDSKVVNSYFLDKINTIYNENFKLNNTPIKNHHKKYINDKYAPAWKTLEFFTFGQVFTVYRNLKDIDLKKAIASMYGIRDICVFENHISSIINIRNICSHSGVLFDFNQPKGIKKIPIDHYKLKTRNQTNINASIRLILFILSNVSKNRATDLEISVKEFMDRYQRYPALKKIFDDHICFDI
ncbi:Abi family protein [Sphingobacteriaceae bacterium WQ 2009]|uniref:Abi family protein n=1 Tax=Rhinopithecimicrobium faecis TaxID=2820698 RepID=A0A8T4HDG0_9SPHI|nr:Abi family protein [Sphingobacteriaceae bacterium WQ 2009]